MYAPATGSTIYAPASGSPNYAPPGNYLQQGTDISVHEVSCTQDIRCRNLSTSGSIVCSGSLHANGIEINSTAGTLVQSFGDRMTFFVPIYCTNLNPTSIYCSGDVSCESLHVTTTQTAAQVFASPPTASGEPTFRSLQCTDISNLNDILQQLYSQLSTPSTNLIANGTFAIPLVGVNSYVNYNALSTAQKTQCIWTSTSSTGGLSWQNGSTAYQYPPVTNLPISKAGIPNTQYISFQSGAEVEQVITVPTTGSYTLTLNYGYRTTIAYPPNAVSIYFGGVLLDSLPNASSDSGWFSYSKTFTVSAGSQQIKFLGATTGADTDTAIANISFIATPQWRP